MSKLSQIFTVSYCIAKTNSNSLTDSSVLESSALCTKAQINLCVTFLLYALIYSPAIMKALLIFSLDFSIKMNNPVNHSKSLRAQLMVQ